MSMSAEFIDVRLQEVPEYLRESVLYKTLLENAAAEDSQKEVFQVPANKFKTDVDNIFTAEEFKHMIATLLFWDSLACPVSMVWFSLDHWDEIPSLLNEEALMLPQFENLKTIMASPIEKRMSIAARIGSLEILQYYCRVDNTVFKKDRDICKVAATYGHLECLKYAHTHGCYWDAKTCKAAAGGHLECLKYAHTNFCYWDADTMSYAFWNGHLACLQYAHTHGCIWNESLRTNTEKCGGNRACIEYVNTYVHDTTDTYEYELYSGHIERVEYTPLRELYADRCESAAARGDLEYLKYAHAQGCEWDSTTCTSAAANGHLECLLYAHTHGCDWNANTCLYAAEGGHLECLQYLHTNGCEWNAQTCSAAARGGHIECLQYAHTNGCPWDANTCSDAAAGGHLDCLQYAHTNGCPWTAFTCTKAAFYGHLQCLQYAHENGCDWDSNTCKYAAERRRSKCLQYARENGCEWDPTACKYVSEYIHMGLFFYDFYPMRF